MHEAAGDHMIRPPAALDMQGGSDGRAFGQFGFVLMKS